MFEILVESDNHLEVHKNYIDSVKTDVAQAFERFEQYITRIEIHFSDQNSNKKGEMDKKCLIEVRIKHHQPIAVHKQAPSLHQALSETIAATKLTVGKLLEKLSYK